MSRPDHFRPDLESSGREIVIASGETRCGVSTMGAMITSFAVDGKDILFPDQNIIVNDHDKRRGGAPILFPQSGKVSDRFKLKPHGFARDSKWNLKDRDMNKVTLGLKKSDDNEVYPHDFDLTLGISVGEQSLTWRLEVTNSGIQTVKIAPGAHPYFNVSQEAWAGIKTNIPGFNIAEYQLGESVTYPAQAEIELSVPGSQRVRILSRGGFNDVEACLVGWSDRKDYFCFEPRHPDGALEDPNQGVDLEPGDIATFGMIIEVD